MFDKYTMTADETEALGRYLIAGKFNNIDFVYTDIFGDIIYNELNNECMCLKLGIDLIFNQNYPEDLIGYKGFTDEDYKTIKTLYDKLDGYNIHIPYEVLKGDVEEINVTDWLTCEALKCINLYLDTTHSKWEDLEHAYHQGKCFLCMNYSEEIHTVDDLLEIYKRYIEILEYIVASIRKAAKPTL